MIKPSVCPGYTKDRLMLSMFPLGFVRSDAVGVGERPPSLRLSPVISLPRVLRSDGLSPTTGMRRKLTPRMKLHLIKQSNHLRAILGRSTQPPADGSKSGR